ncbi:hypothetical protein AQI95_06895 [Streptomyces yokosukanensis]|uniref:Uncharacterized protein n=2 Tax=Streptomyces yokosukanensis TaxID=67386 RepID=A0A117Q4T2_9ACTN|nr:hypothetical protein AQI95_06895 [Streptomyces yokosukanensis]
MASKADYFEDPQVQRLLIRNGLRVHITRMGSRGIATQSYDGYDVVIPSGQPAADLITHKRTDEGHQAAEYAPFFSPIVLGTYREYAETLQDAGIATPLPGTPAGQKPLYYSLNMKKFLRTTADGVRWDRLGLARHGLHNGNQVLAQTSGICDSNSAGTYMGLVSYVWNHDSIPQNPTEATRFADRIRLLFNDQGLSSAGKSRTYASDEGKSEAPIAVIYEHQFLAYQIRAQARTGHVDGERVLLYPSAQIDTEPQLIALTPDGDRLSRLVNDDPALQKRAVELGFRVKDAQVPGATSSAQTRFLRERHIPAPGLSGDDTKAVLPRLGLLERMIEDIGACASVPQGAADGEAP